MDKKSGVVRGALALTVSALMVKVLGVVYKIPLSYILGDEGMGYFNSAYSVYAFFYILATAGVPKAVAMLTTEAGETSGEYKAREIYKRLLKIFALFGIVTTFGFILLCKPMSALLGNKNSYMTMLSIAPTIFFVSLAGVSRGYLNGRERFAPIAISQVIEAISKLAFGIVFAYLGIRLSFSLPNISAFTVLGITLGSFFSALYLYFATFSAKPDKNVGQRIEIVNSVLVKKIAKVALPITLSSSVLSITNIIDLGITMRALESLGFSEPESSALYGNYTTLAVPMFNLVVSVLTPLSLACLPRLLSAQLKRNIVEYNDLLSWGLTVTAIIAAPCALILFLYPFDILDILFSSQASAIGAELLSALSLSALLVPLLTFVNTALESTGRIRMSVASLIFGAVVKVVLSGVLISSGDLGMLGVPISTLISYSVSLALSLIFLGGVKGINIKWTAVLGPMISASLAYIPIFLAVFCSGLAGSGAYSVIACILISTLIYACLEFKTLKKQFFNGYRSKYRQKTQNAIIE